MRDMRAFIAEWREQSGDDYLEVERPVSPAFELAAVQRKLAARGRFPVILFRRVAGFDMPVVTGLYHDRRRLAAALGTDEAGLPGRVVRSEAEPLEPQRTDAAPVQEIVWRGSDCDLRRLPVVTAHQQDAGPYLTASVVLAEDPDSGAHNVSFGRFQVVDGQTLYTHIGPGRHLHQIHSSNEAAGRPTPISINLGHHPAWAIGALSLVPLGFDELRVMGGLAGEPVRVARCVSVAADCLADCEIVLEGEILAGVRGIEGPFCEFPGYATGAAERQAVRVQAITTRTQPIFQHLTSATPEALLIGAVAKEASLLRAARAAAPSVRAVHVPLSGCGRFLCYVSLDQRARGQARGVAAAILGADIFTKVVVVVDHDVDVYREQEVLWAVATRCQPDRDVLLLPGMRGTEVDPSSPEPGLTGKMIVDATAKPSLAEFAPRASLPPGPWDALDIEAYLSLS